MVEDLLENNDENIIFKDFIGIFRNVYPPGYCKHLITQFDILESNGAGRTRFETEKANRHVKEDVFMFLGFDYNAHHIEPFEGHGTVQMFFKGLQMCYDNYVNKYSLLDTAKIKASIMKVQKSAPGAGYHVWHFEQGPNELSSRVLTYILYLNTLQCEGGETEFLYQKTRIKPEENMLIICPASFTHTHRGNPVLGEENKYIATGWFNII